MEIEWLTGLDLHRRVILEEVLQAQRTVWIATANLKDLHVPLARGRYRPILEEFERMAARGVQFRVIHGDVPSRSFRRSFDAQRNLVGGGLELQVCPRCHWKMVIVDGAFGYAGSANFTGAGLGAKTAGRRNLELGAVGRDPQFVAWLAARFDDFWIGLECTACGRRALCPDPITG